MDKNTGNTPIRDYDSLISRTRTAIGTGNVWNHIAVPTSITTGLLLGTSWLGLWSGLPPVARVTVTLAFATVGLIDVFKRCAGKSLLLSRKEAAKHLDIGLGDPQDEPMRALGRTLPADSTEKDLALWNGHREKLWQEWKDRVSAPKTGIDFSDRKHKILYAVAFCTAVSGFVAGDQRMDRLKEMFGWSANPTTEETVLAPAPDTIEAPPATPEPTAAEPLDVRAWIAPPPRIFSSGVLYLNDGNQKTPDLSAHRNSVLTVEVRNRAADLFLNGEAVEPAVTGASGAPPIRYEIMLGTGDYTIKVAGGPSWSVTITPDEAPTIDLHGADRDIDDPNSLRLRYQAKDDFGIVNKTIRLRRDGSDDPDARPLPSLELPELNFAPQAPGQ